ncbi:MAG: ATP-dependent zinc protease family protein, partial [Gammaproteobacteria bacterium]
LGIAKIKAKVDTGARTSALHAFEIIEMSRDGVPWVRFGVHPEQHSTEREIWCEAPILDKRIVRDSGGHEQERPVIKTPIRLGDSTWAIEMTLTNRDNMGFRVLLGRTAIRDRYLVDPGRSYLTGRGLATPKAAS